MQPDDFPVTYKYAVISSPAQLDLEAGENRLISLPTQAPLQLVVQEDGHFR